MLAALPCHVLQAEALTVGFLHSFSGPYEAMLSAGSVVQRPSGVNTSSEERGIRLEWAEAPPLGLLMASSLLNNTHNPRYSSNLLGHIFFSVK